MINRVKLSGAALASAAALLFTSSGLMAAENAAEEVTVKCEGGNGCKGKSACHTATNACAGQNSCKGKGYVMLPKTECTAAQAANKAPATKL
jgi:uncharacterized membrane protein